jgi:transposase
MQWTVAIGVDTDKEVDVAVALDRLGAQLDSREIAATPAGYRRLLSWAQELGVPAFAIEGTGQLRRRACSLPRASGGQRLRVRAPGPSPRRWSTRGPAPALARAARCHAASRSSGAVPCSHRLNRGGDRQLNWALHVVALQRIRHHPETSAYHERLLAAGKSTREARRCVKRALARHFFHRCARCRGSP